QSVQRGMTELMAAVPVWTTPFVGREAAQARLSEWFAEESGGLITLTASAGTGKTRLALETAVEQSALFPDGVWYVPLTERNDPALALMEIASASGLALQPGDSPQKQLREFLKEKNALLLL